MEEDKWLGYWTKGRPITIAFFIGTMISGFVAVFLIQKGIIPRWVFFVVISLPMVRLSIWLRFKH